MDFSEAWKSTWPVAAVFPAPNLLAGAAANALGPLLFASSSPPRSLFSSPSLARPPPRCLLPSSLRDGLHAFFRDPSEGFVPTSDQADVLDAVLPAEEDPAIANQLHVLRCRDGATFLLFFPTGWNADEVGYLCLCVRNGEPEIVDDDGKVFRQREGLAHPLHRITGMSAVPADPPDVGWGAPVDPAAEGMIHEQVLPEISIAKDEDPSASLQSQKLQDEKHFFIHEPRACASGSPIHQKINSLQQKGHKSYNFGSSETTVKNDKFSIFISRTQEKPDCKSNAQDIETLEMFDDLSPISLDIEQSGFRFAQQEHKIFSSLKRQFSKWQSQSF